jgi:hypothetical protein
LPLRKYPPAINADPEWNNLVDFLGGPTALAQIDTTKIKEQGASPYLFQNKGYNVALALGTNVISLVATEPDTNYIVFIIVVGATATVRVTAKTTTAFTVDASAATNVDWVLIR